MSHYKQSPEWSTYMNTLGWQILETPWGKIYNKKILLWTKIGKAPRLVFEQPTEQIPQLVTILKKEKITTVTLEPELTSQVEQLEQSLRQNKFKPTKYPLTPPSTLIIDLEKNLPQLEKDLHQLAKRQLKKAAQEQVETICYRWPIPEQELEIYDQLAKKTSQRQNCDKETLKQLKSKAKLLKDKCFLLLTNYHQKPVAGVFMIVHDRIAYYHHAASYSLAHKTGASYITAWKAIILAKKLGCQKFDFEGILDSRFPRYCAGWQGFSEFKKKFGGVLVSYPKPVILNL